MKLKGIRIVTPQFPKLGGKNPDRPGTCQWEGLDYGAAQELIGKADNYIDVGRFDVVREAEDRTTEQFRNRLDYLELGSVG